MKKKYKKRIATLLMSMTMIGSPLIAQAVNSMNGLFSMTARAESASYVTGVDLEAYGTGRTLVSIDYNQQQVYEAATMALTTLRAAMYERNPSFQQHSDVHAALGYSPSEEVMDLQSYLEYLGISQEDYIHGWKWSLYAEQVAIQRASEIAIAIDGQTMITNHAWSNGVPVYAMPEISGENIAINLASIEGAIEAWGQGEFNALEENHGAFTEASGHLHNLINPLITGYAFAFVDGVAVANFTITHLGDNQITSLEGRNQLEVGLPQAQIQSHYLAQPLISESLPENEISHNDSTIEYEDESINLETFDRHEWKVYLTEDGGMSVTIFDAFSDEALIDAINHVKEQHGELTFLLVNTYLKQQYPEYFMEASSTTSSSTSTNVIVESIQEWDNSHSEQVSDDSIPEGNLPAPMTYRTLTSGAVTVWIESSESQVDHLLAKEITDDALIATLDDGKLVDLYDIQLKNTQGEVISTTTPIRVQINLNPNLTFKDVVHVTEDHRIEPVPLQQKDGHLVAFQVDHFSRYMIRYQEDKITPTEQSMNVKKTTTTETSDTKNKHLLPKTGEANRFILIMAAVIVLVAGSILIFGNKKD